VLDLLYVEDDRDESDFFRLALEQLSSRTRYRIVATSEAAREILDNHRVKVILSDVVLGDEKGTDLLKFAAEEYPETFRVMITGQASADVLEQGINEAHVHYVIYKPCNIYDEIQALQGFMNRSPIPDIRPAETKGFMPRDWHFADVDEPAHSQAIDAIAPRTPPAEAVHLLVVDDVADMRRLIGNTLASSGYHAVLVESGAKALELIFRRQQRFDLIISDWMMPGMTGPEFIQTLHQHEEFASTPTILLTAKSDEQSRALATRVGANAYINKPFDDLELIATVDNLLDLKKRERKIEELNRYIAQNVLQRFLPPQLVRDIVEGRSTLDEQAKQMDVTVLFADLCNFTRATEQLSPQSIANILNTFFVQMSAIIFEHGGTVDKFIGDGIMIIFGAPTPMSVQDQVDRAHRCAKAMHVALAALNVEWQRAEHYTFHMRIGMHCGPAIVGSFGGPQRADYTAVGHTVNLASRVETMADADDIVMTEAVTAWLPEDAWEPIGSFKVKGLDLELPLFRVKKSRMGQVA
jgi:class 3 adenylate cyclase/CheY-like chemotaxis protein